MKNSLSSFVFLFDELLTTIEAIGVDSTIKTLQEAKSNSLILTDFNIEFIFSVVCEVTSLSKDRIINGKDKSDDRKLALALCVHFMKNEFNYSYKDIAKIVKKDESALSKYNSYVKNLPTKTKTDFDKKLESYIKKINLLIAEKKINN
jgi:hypothetical protein